MAAQAPIVAAAEPRISVEAYGSTGCLAKAHQCRIAKRQRGFKPCAEKTGIRCPGNHCQKIPFSGEGLFGGRQLSKKRLQGTGILPIS